MFFILAPLNSMANDPEYMNKLEKFINGELKKISYEDIIINSVRRQNDKNYNLSDKDLKALQRRWISQKNKKKQPLIDEQMGNIVSRYLKKIQEDSNEKYTQIIVIDNKGLNVGQSIVTENYLQSGQDIWKKTFGNTSYKDYISDLYYNDTTGLFQVDVSFIITSDDQPIGVLYAGIDIELLEDKH